MTLVHQLPKLFHFLSISHLCIITRCLEIVHALALCKHVHGPLVKEELRILSAHFFDVGHILN